MIAVTGVAMLPLHSLGQRIVVVGPSNAGKSTLAVAISQKLGFPTVHLDQLHHLPHTDWLRRPETEFAELHDAAILGEQWVMEGNYSRLMPQRLARATGAILLTSNHWLRFSRYLKCTLVNRSVMTIIRDWDDKLNSKNGRKEFAEKAGLPAASIPEKVKWGFWFGDFCLYGERCTRPCCSLAAVSYEQLYMTVQCCRLAGRH